MDEFTDGIGEGYSWNWSMEEKQAALNCADEIISCEIVLNNETFDKYGETSFRAGLVAFRAGWFCKKFLLLKEAALWLEEREYPVLKMNAAEAITEYPHCCTNLATLYIKTYELTGDTESLLQAERYINEAYEVTNANYEAICLTSDISSATIMHQHIAGVRMEQAELCMKRGDYKAAQTALDEANDIISSYSENGADFVYLTSKYAAMYYFRGDYVDAITALNKTNELYEQVLSGEQDYSLNVNIMLAECYENMQDGEKALQAWQKAYEIADNSLVPDHPTMKKIISHLNEM